MRINSSLSRTLVLLLIAFTVACRSGNQSSEQESRERVNGKPGGRLVVADRATPKTFNFLKATDLTSATIASYLMQSHLAEFDHDKQQFVPGLAESWQAADGGKTITVKLRDGLKFSDGHPLTADDVIFTLKVASDEKAGSPFRDNFMVGGQPIKATKVDDRTVKLELVRPAAAIESLFSIFGVLPKHKLEDIYNKGDFAKAWDISVPAAELAVSGPFVLKEYIANQRTILAKNPNYWKKDAAGKPLPYLDELVIEAIPDANTALLKFQQGEVDLMDNISAANYATLKQQSSAAYSVRDYGASMLTDFLWFNQNDRPGADAAKKSWFTDSRFRHAVAMAIDRKAIIDNVLRGLGSQVNGMVSPSNKRWINNDLPAQILDLEKARNLLKEAGFVVKDNQLTDKSGKAVEFTLVVDDSQAPRKAMATIIQEDLAKLGMKVNLATLEKNAFVEMIEKKLDYDAAIHGIAPSDTDPSTQVTGFKTGGGQRYWNLTAKQPAADWEKKFDKLVDDLDTTSESTARMKVFNDLQRVFADELPMIPLVVRNFASGAKTGLGNYRPSVILPRSMWNAEELFWKK